jgi:hypothetical protein
MKSMILSAVLSAMIALNLSAQNQLPNFIVYDGHKSTYQQNGKYLTQEELAEVLKSNMESVKEYNKREALSKTGAAFFILGFLSSSGAVLSTTSALKAHIDGNNDKASKIINGAEIALWGGLGLITISAVIGGTSKSHLRKSINNYNNSLKTGKIENGKIYFGFSGNGIGVRLRF